ncbi:MAG: 2-C-methyl-D-erythritol 4-phosphate cytidylyltransferase [Phycisphaerales bacterium]|nr:2-C-methyl-D-erythritol 4-phosphate cytidylyltransferase [Phycisphaerales bacterium]
MKLTVIIPAAGKSTRFEGPVSKLEQDLGGRPVLQRTVEVFSKHPEVDHIIVAGPHEGFEEFKVRHGDKLGLLGVTLCRGGVTHRWETVRAALDEVPEDSTHIAVHDAARPCVPLDLLERVLEAASKYPAVIPAIAVSDTLKRVSAEATKDVDIDPLDAILGDAGKTLTDVRRVEATLDRANVMAVQTPQVFEAEILRRAYAQSDLTSTDDAGLVERLGVEVTVVEGDPRNLKITRPVDLELARAILKVKMKGDDKPLHKRF